MIARAAGSRERLFLIMAAYAVAWFLLIRLPGDILRAPNAGSDLSSYYTAGYLVRTGQAGSLYDVQPGDTILGDATGGPWREAGTKMGVGRQQHYYIYPPFFALLASPLSLLSFAAARLGWLGLELLILVCIVGAYALSRRGDGTALTPPEWALIAITMGLEFLPLIWELAIGQTSLVLMALLVACLFFMKRGQQTAAGILLGIAAGIKLTPVLLVVYCALRGRMKAALWAAAALAVTLIVPVILLGPAVSIRFFAEVVPMMSGGTSYFLNQSLTGFFDRLLDAADPREVALATSSAARGLAITCGLIMLSITTVRIRSLGAGRPEGLALDLEFWAVFLLTLMLSPISWAHHYLPALVCVWTIVAVASRSGRRSLLLALSAGVAFLLIARKPHADLFLGGIGRLGLSASLYGGLILWGACLILMSWTGPGAQRQPTSVELRDAA